MARVPALLSAVPAGITCPLPPGHYMPVDGLEDNDMHLCRRLLLCVALGVRTRSWHVGAFPGNWRRAGGPEVSHPAQPFVSRALTRPPKTRKERVKNRRRGYCAPGCHIHPTKPFIKGTKLSRKKIQTFLAQNLKNKFFLGRWGYCAPGGSCRLCFSLIKRDEMLAKFFSDVFRPSRPKI